MTNTWTAYYWPWKLSKLKQEIDAQPFQTGSCGSCRAVHEGGSCAIPDAPLYVLSNDTFMSGWGPARERINVCVVPVASDEEAKLVEAYMESRDDQRYIRRAHSRPRARGRLLSLLLAWRENALERSVTRRNLEQRADVEAGR
jgi:hypothetical protein